jgi:hypothetical protein
MAQHPPYFIPINFDVTDRGKEAICTVVESCRKSGKDPIAVIGWELSRMGPDGIDQEINAPILGIHYRDEIPPDAVQNCNGLDLMFNVSAKIALNFEGQVLDFTPEQGLHFTADKQPRNTKQAGGR